MRKVLVISGIVVGAAILSVAALFLLVDPNRFHDQIVGELQKQLHRPVSVGKMSLNLFPLGVGVEDLSIGEKPEIRTGQPFATAKNIAVKADLFTLLRGQISVDSLVLTSPVITLAKGKDGKWNFADLTSSESSNSKPVTLDLLKITDGSVVLFESKALYQHLDVEVTGIGPGRKMGIKAAVHLPGDKGGTLNFEGTGPAPFDGKLIAKDASLSALTAFAGSKSVLDGALSGDINLKLDQTRTTVTGRLDLANATRSGKALNIPMALDFSVVDDTATGKIQASQLNITAGKLNAKGSGEYDSKAATVNGKLSLPGADLAEVLALAQVFGGPEASGTGSVSLNMTIRGPVASPEYAGDGSLQNVELKLASLTKPLGIKTAAIRLDGRSASISNLDASLAGTNIKGNGSISNFTSPNIKFDLAADKLDVAEWQQLPAATSETGSGGAARPPSAIYAQGTLRVGTLLSQGLQLSDVQAQALYLDQKLTLSPLSAKLFGGTQSGRLVADLKPKVPTVSLDIKMAGVEANQLLTATSSLKNMLYGALAANGGLSMHLGAGDMPKTLNGKLSASLANGHLAGTDILKELAGVGKFLGYQGNPQSVTNIAQLGGDVDFKDGLATTNNLQMVMDGGSLGAAGTINLVDQTINLKATAILDKAFSQKVGGTSVGGYLSTALSNSKGELVLPVIITGTFDKPRFAPDAARFAEMKLKSLMPTGITPQGIIGIFGRGRQPVQDAQPGTQPTQQNQPANPAQSIIDMFKKKK